ncbi:beta-ketoacyl synthase [Xylariaceae sp. FL0594]|nr:beta-ketoacyl synthase [Xylariaceae sp. FL0594]
MDFLIHIQGDPDSGLTPLLLVHAISGLSIPYLHLKPLRRVNSDGTTTCERPVYGINSPLYTSADFQMPSTFHDLAALYVAEIQRTLLPRGPYLLGGWSMGGIIALKMAQILLEQGHQVRKVIMLDSPNPETFPPFKSEVEHRALVEATYSQSVAHKLAFAAGETLSESDGSESESEPNDEDEDDSIRHLADLTRKHIADSFLLFSNQSSSSSSPGCKRLLPFADDDGNNKKLDTHVVLIKCKTALRIGETVLLNRSAYMLGYMRDKLMNWDADRFRSFERIDFSGDHYGAFDQPYIDELTGIFCHILADVD